MSSHHGHRNDNMGSCAAMVKPISRGSQYLPDWRDQRPVPPLSDFEAYRDTVDVRARKHIDPVKYRRITIMARNGTPVAEAARMVGYAATPHGYKKMPEHLW